MNKYLINKIVIIVMMIMVIPIIGCSMYKEDISTNMMQEVKTDTPDLKSKILFINTSRHSDGNTTKMGEVFLDGIEHDTIFLNDYKIYQLGQHFDDDQFNVVLQAMEQADTIVIGTPVYWHTMSGPLKTFIDRLYELDKPVKALAGKKLYFLMQGASPSQETIKQTPYIMSRVANQYDMKYMGAATDIDDLDELRAILEENL